MGKQICRLIILFLSLNANVFAQEFVDLDIIHKIKEEAFENSQVMETLCYLTDVYGPRLAGSPSYRNAAQWARDKLEQWGLEEAKLESWGVFGRGWSYEKVSLEMTQPHYMPIIAYPKAWTSGTNGIITGTPVLLEINSDEDLEKYRDSLKNKMVMLGKPFEVMLKFKADAKRFSMEELQEMAKAPDPGAKPEWQAERDKYRERYRLFKKMVKFVKEEDAGLVLLPSRRQDGTVRVYGGESYKLNSDKDPPTLIVAIEHYGRLVRLLEKNIPVEIKAEVQTSFYQDDSLGYNIVAEIPGNDRNLKKEIVMLGAHLDSWHAGTGATDNASGCAVVMEAVRILKTIAVKPRRTIRIALWDGEEQEYFGSRGYIKKHFGDASTMQLKPDHANFSVYFNIDNGAGRIRGIYLQNNDAARPVFETWLEPFHDLDATTVTIRETTGTDHIPFNEIGLPAFQFIQDELDYDTRTHHTNMDVYEHVLAGDIMQASAIMASFVYHAAMRDEKIPRKPLPTKKDMNESD